MRIVVVGYGRMGREIEAAARDRGHEVVARIDPAAADADYAELAAAAEAGALQATTPVIDFSLGAAVPQTVDTCARSGSSLVIGATGWEEAREVVLRRADEAGIGLVWGANFSVGANLFARIVAHAGALAERAGGYDPAIVELHHRGKQDSPSGTALMLAEQLLQRSAGKTRLQTEALHRRIENEELHVASARVGSVPGTHTVYLDSTADTVELTHRARNRHGFAVGAVQAAEWITRVGGLHSVDDFFDDLFG